MKKFYYYLFIIAAMVAMCNSALAQYSFTSIAPSGQKMGYKINPNTWTEVNTVTLVNMNGSWSTSQIPMPSGYLIIPSTVEYDGITYTVNAIGEMALSHSNLDSVSIPNTIKSIGKAAFSQCSGLKAINIPKDVTVIGEGAFKGCKELTSIILPNSLTEIGAEAFYGCKGINAITIPDSVTSIGYRAFYNCIGLTSINIPLLVTKLGNEAFSNCLGLETVYFDAKNCTVSGGYVGSTTVFDICINLTTVVFGNTVKSIDKGIFTGCQNISTVKANWCPLYDSPTQMPYYVATLDNTSNIFYGVPIDKAILVVPVGYSSYYTATTTSPYHRPWSLFGTITEDSLRHIAVSSCNIEMGTATGGGNFMIGKTATIAATSHYGYHFVKWSDDITDNPRTLTCTQDSSLVAIFEPNNYTLTCPNAIGEGTYPYLSDVQIHAIPQGNLQFRGWADGVMANPRVVTLVCDTTLSAIFTPADTAYIHDTTTIYDTLYVDVHDTTYVPVHDTTYINVHDTTYIDVHDTTYINVHDTTYINVHDTTCINVHDTTYINVHDTTYINVHDTTYINVHDTTYINVHDTTYIDVHDTTYIMQVDTLIITLYDTLTLTVYDTVDNYIFDTVDNYIYDTIDNYIYDTVDHYIYDTVDHYIYDTVDHYIYDTVDNYIFDTVDNYIYDTVTLIDTLWLTDTVYIHDTIYITDEAVGDVTAPLAKVYSSQGQIVVEGAEGCEVTLYDAVGRRMAARRDDFAMLRFDVPASGAYLVKVGHAPARRVVVIK